MNTRTALAGSIAMLALALLVNGAVLLLRGDTPSIAATPVQAQSLVRTGPEGVALFHSSGHFITTDPSGRVVHLWHFKWSADPHNTELEYISTAAAK